MDDNIPRLSIESDANSSVGSLAPISSHQESYRRPSSVISSVSSSAGYNARLSTSTSFSSLIPSGLSRSHNRLGSNSIGDLIDANSSGANGNRRSGGSSFFKPPSSSATDIPSVKLTSIPRVSKAQLLKYTNDISMEYNTFFSNRLSRRPGTDSGEDLVSVSGVSASGISDDTDRTELPASGVTSPRLGESGADRSYPPSRTPTPITPLSTIPSVFFEQDNFQLDNPKIFGAVSETSSEQDSGQSQQQSSSSRTIDEGTDRMLANNNAILQEKLSWYIDTVELHLIREISTASQSFFSTLGELKSINEKTSECIQKIRKLKNELKLADANVATKGIERLKRGQAAKNAGILLRTLRQIQLIEDKRLSAESQLNEGDKDGCLDALDATECLVSGSKENDLVKRWLSSSTFSNIVDLRGVNALNEIREHLRVLRTKAGDQYSREFVQLLVDDINSHLKKVNQMESLQRLGQVLARDKRTSFERTPRPSLDGDQATDAMTSTNNTGATASHAYLQVDPELREQLLKKLEGLARADNTVSAFNMYKDSVLKLGKNIVRMYLPTRNDNGTNGGSGGGGDQDDDAMSVSSVATSRSSLAEKSISLAAALRQMSAEEAQYMIVNIYVSLCELYRRLSTQQKLLLDLTSSLQRDSVVVIDVSDVVQGVIRDSESRMAKILKVRREQIISTPSLQMFINFYTLNGVYLADCEAICGDPCKDLNLLLGSMIKQYLGAFHKLRDAQLCATMDDDKWKEVEISPQVQRIVDNIVQSGQEDPEAWVMALRQVLDQPSTTKRGGENDGGNNNHNNNKSNNTNGNSNNGNGKEQQQKVLPRNVFVEKSSFIITSGAITMIRLMEEYLQLSGLLPHLSQEVGGNLADLIKKFNSKATQLILGAGATRSAGLKHITAKHLSLSSECIHILMELIPHVKNCLQRHMPGGPTSMSVLSEFDHIFIELRDHREEIHNKFVSLMSDKMRNHCDTISKTDWNQQKASAEVPVSSSIKSGEADKTSESILQPRKYAMDIVKDTSVLVKIISRILPKDTAVLITSSIFDNYKRQLLDAYTRIQLQEATAKEAMLCDVEYLRDNLSNLDGAGNAMQVIWENVNSMAVQNEHSNNA